MFLNPQQIRALVSAIEPRVRALVLMASMTGLKWAELAALRIEDVDFRFGAAVRRTLSEVNGSLYLKDTKNDRVRVVPLPDVLLSELRTHIDSGYAGAEVDCLVHVGESVTTSAAGFLFSSANGVYCVTARRTSVSSSQH